MENSRRANVTETEGGNWTHFFELETNERTYVLHTFDRVEYELWMHVFVWIIR
jgi:hypothetical protein